ncbi:hypothetical protein AX17_004617 [Amanita inopinata Kibby_2008]|nr:hypothetical protein AX17_004617 [Amanita inopinata Kibby_2008]
MSAVHLISQHILAHFYSSQRKPLFVALQGPQGSGKSYTASQLYSYLSSPPLSLRVAVLSIDDLYLPRTALRSLAESNPGNCLLYGRGLPGTHDVDLGARLFSAFRDGASDVEIPRFDKSLHNGEGDRLPLDGSGTVIRQPPSLDIVILEGWCVGFYPISTEELEEKWRGEWKKECALLGLGEDNLPRICDITKVNEILHEYVKLWEVIDTFVRIKPMVPAGCPSQYSIIYKWRLEQEHNMKSKNGGVGMSDDRVKAFVDRYIPGYIFFEELPSKEALHPKPRWVGKGLTVFIDEERKLVTHSTF